MTNISQMWDELNMYYDIDMYKDLKIDKDTKLYRQGTNKLVYKINNITASITKNAHTYIYNLTSDINNHLKILYNYYKNTNYHIFFTIPKIYRHHEYYITEYFDLKPEVFYNKTHRLSIFCINYGKFLNFMFKKCKMDYVDVESYIYSDKLIFIDFGECKDVYDGYIDHFIGTLQSYCIINDSMFYGIKDKDPAYNNPHTCKMYIDCIIYNILNDDI